MNTNDQNEKLRSNSLYNPEVKGTWPYANTTNKNWHDFTTQEKLDAGERINQLISDTRADLNGE